jgi:hypothetical protein
VLVPFSGKKKCSVAKKKAACYSETFLATYQTTQCYNLEKGYHISEDRAASIFMIKEIFSSEIGVSVLVTNDHTM